MVANSTSAWTDLDPMGQVEHAAGILKDIKAAVQSQMTGQNQQIHTALSAIVARGHVLFEGLPGLGKTFLTGLMARVSALEIGRIQCTPDLMPSNILGTEVYRGDRSASGSFEFERGPIFSEICFVDELNRASPRVQAALLQGMQEREVTVAGVAHKLPDIFTVIATQNPQSQSGTFPLPEAQLDRFMVCVRMTNPTREEFKQILQTVGGKSDGERIASITPVCEPSDDKGHHVLTDIRALARQIPVPDNVDDYIVRLVEATRPDDPRAPEVVKQNFAAGSAGVRGGQALRALAQASALVFGQTAVNILHVRDMAPAVLAHRVEGKSGRDIKSPVAVIRTIAHELAR